MLSTLHHMEEANGGATTPRHCHGTGQWALCCRCVCHYAHNTHLNMTTSIRTGTILHLWLRICPHTHPHPPTRVWVPKDPSKLAQNFTPSKSTMCVSKCEKRIPKRDRCQHTLATTVRGRRTRACGARHIELILTRGNRVGHERWSKVEAMDGEVGLPQGSGAIFDSKIDLVRMCERKRVFVHSQVWHIILDCTHPHAVKHRSDGTETHMKTTRLSIPWDTENNHTLSLRMWVCES